MTDDTAVAVVGAGVMGTGISTLIVGQGVPVVLVDVDEAALRHARTKVTSGLRHAQLMGVLPSERTCGELRTTLSLSDVAGASVVIESITELTELKSKVLTELSTLARPGTPLVSN